MVVSMPGMWMGPRGGEQWIRATSIESGGTFGKLGWSSTMYGLNGGATQRNSLTTHMEYNLSWKSISRKEAAKVQNMYSGFFGDGYIYLIDPMSADRNALPEWWAFPWLGVKDAPPIFGNTRPTASTTPSNSIGLPANSATYTFTAAASADPLYIPIPIGYTAWLCVEGIASSTSGVFMQGSNGNTLYGSKTLVPINDASNGVLTFAGFPRGAGTGVVLTLGTTLTSLPVTATYSGIMLQILPDGTTPSETQFINGEGASGMRFKGAPLKTPISARYDMVSLAAALIEMEGWQ